MTEFTLLGLTVGTLLGWIGSITLVYGIYIFVRKARSEKWSIPNLIWVYIKIVFTGYIKKWNS